MPCIICGSPIAPFGFQQPGPRNRRTDHRRISACADHIQDAEARWRAAFPQGRIGGADRGGTEGPQAGQGAAQASLFGDT